MSRVDPSIQEASVATYRRRHLLHSFDSCCFCHQRSVESRSSFKLYAVSQIIHSPPGLAGIKQSIDVISGSGHFGPGNLIKRDRPCDVTVFRVIVASPPTTTLLRPSILSCEYHSESHLSLSQGE